MKVALIGDVHGNLPALEAVLADAAKKGVDAIWNVGDFVGYGAYPDEVVQRLKRDDITSVIGNYDRKVLKVKKKLGQWKKKTPQKWQAFKWAYKHLSKKSRKYLRTLPRNCWIGLGSYRVLLTHGSPRSIKEHLTPDTPEDYLAKMAEKAKADVIVVGHSHIPFVRKVGEVYYINPGSVGRPDDGDPRASYAILKISTKVFEVEHYRVEYDIEKAVSAIREHHLPEEFAQMVLQGKNLDSIIQDGSGEENEPVEKGKEEE
jgi:putative phosphoesterase